MGGFTAFRFTIDASATQSVVLARHAGAARFGFNQCLAIVKQALDARRVDGSVPVPWSGFDLINAFNRWKRGEDAGRVIVVDSQGSASVEVTGLAWRTQVCAQVFEEAAVDLGRALTGYRDSRRGERAGRRVGFPRFKRKTTCVPSFRLRQKTSGGRAGIRVGDAGPRTVTLPKIGVLRVREDTRRLRRMLALGRAEIRFVTVSRRAGRWTVSVTVRAADLHPNLQHPHRERERRGGGGGWVGVDRGLTAFVVAATTTGREVLRITPPRPLRCGQTRLRHLSRAVTRKRKGSTNRARATARLGRAHARVRNIRHEFLHKVANRLVQTHDRLAFEDLHIAGMVANHRLAAAISDASWGHLLRIVRYKQAWRHGHLTLVDRFYPSTKTCHRCGNVATRMPLSSRVFDCSACGCRLDRDLNAAINLAIWTERHHAQIRDPDTRGPVINASRGDGSGPRHHVGETSPGDGGTPPQRPTAR